MKSLALLAAMAVALLAAPSLCGAPPDRSAASRHYRLAWFEPTGGEAAMSSPRYRLHAFVAPPLSGPMRSERFAISPLLRSPGPAPAGYRVLALH